MKAAVFYKYGPPEMVQVKNVNKPVIGNKEVLVRVHASTVTSADNRMRSANYGNDCFFSCMGHCFMGCTKPRNPILGNNFAGEVVSVGSKVTRFKEGDLIFGASMAMGAHAEFLKIKEDGAITHKPEKLNFEEATAMTFGATTALIYLRDLGKVAQGEKILVNGASGAVGTMAVQLAKNEFGAEVTAICSGSNHELVKSLGADNAIDYRKEDFTQNGKEYDVILDTIGNLTFGNCKNSLNSEGRFLQVVAVSCSGACCQTCFCCHGKKKYSWTVVVESQKSMLALKDLAEKKKIKPVIDKRFSLENVVEAHAYVATGRKKGAVIVTIIPEDDEKKNNTYSETVSEEKKKLLS